MPVLEQHLMPCTTSGDSAAFAHTSWELSLRPFPVSITSWQGRHSLPGSVTSCASNRIYWAKHVCTKHYETHCWESFKQLIFCYCSLHDSPTCTETYWSQDFANKGRAQLNIHFPRHLLLPIPFLLFSTPLTLRTHCRCCYFVCFEILLPRSRFIPVGFSKLLSPSQMLFFPVRLPQLLIRNAHSERMVQESYCLWDWAAFYPEWAESSSSPAATQWN